MFFTKPYIANRQIVIVGNTFKGTKLTDLKNKIVGVQKGSSSLEALEKNGYIRRDPSKPRAIEIIDDSFQMVRQEMTSIPIVGNVAAGEPLFAEQNINGYFPSYESSRIFTSLQ